VEYAGERTGNHRSYYFETEPGLGDFYDESGREMHGGWLRTPLHYEHVSSGFDLRRVHPVLHRIMPHTGIDYAAAPGTPVWAAADGTITFIGDRGPNGNLVSIRHDGAFESFYAHLSRFASGLRVGTVVRQRQVIGYVGSTGRSTGPHLHFGLKRRGRFVDPAHQLNGPGRMLAAPDLGAYHRRAQRLAQELDRIELAPAPTGSGTTAPATPRAEDFAEEVEVPAPRPRSAPRRSPARRRQQ
jgi:murein DD-endopeptidase MepM/ murein hydrolase activator NlpD